MDYVANFCNIEDILNSNILTNLKSSCTVHTPFNNGIIENFDNLSYSTFSPFWKNTMSPKNSTFEKKKQIKGSFLIAIDPRYPK